MKFDKIRRPESSRQQQQQQHQGAGGRAMLQIGWQKYMWLLLLLLYLALAVQLMVSGSRIQRHSLSLNPEIRKLKQAEAEHDQTMAQQLHPGALATPSPSTLTAAMTKSTAAAAVSSSAAVLSSASPHKANASRVGRSRVAQQKPLVSESQLTIVVDLPRESAAPTKLLERIRRASDSRLYAKLLDKLKSLEQVAGLETRLKDAVSKCAIKANGQALPALKYVQTYAYLHKPSTLCYGDVLALIAVHSNAKNLAHRAAIRRTWGSLRYVGSHRIDVAFFLGRPASGDATPSGVSGAELQALIDEESSRYGDIVQLDFTENYRNMTIKHLSVYEWVLVHCHAAKYLVKVDDDTFTDVAHLATFLSRGPPQGLYCSATGGAKPQRVRKGSKAKWTVTEAEYSDRFYPAYCEGFGYTIQADRIPDVYFCSMFKRFFWIDDVHVTGVLAAAASVPLSRFWRGHSYAVMLPSQASESIMDYIFLTAERSEFFESIWHKLWYAVLQHSLDLNL